MGVIIHRPVTIMGVVAQVVDVEFNFARPIALPTSDNESGSRYCRKIVMTSIRIVSPWGSQLHRRLRPRPPRVLAEHRSAFSRFKINCWDNRRDKRDQSLFAIRELHRQQVLCGQVHHVRHAADWSA